MSNVETLSHADVISVICEYCRLCGYKQTIRVIRQESAVPCNVVESLVAAPSTTDTTDGNQEPQVKMVNTLQEAVLMGDWQSIMSAVDGLYLSKAAQFALFETLAKDLVNVHRQAGAATQLLHHSPIFKVMKKDEPTRHARLVCLASSPDISASSSVAVASSSSTTTADREALWSVLEREITFIPKTHDATPQSASNTKVHGSMLLQAIGSVLGKRTVRTLDEAPSSDAMKGNSADTTASQQLKRPRLEVSQSFSGCFGPNNVASRIKLTSKSHAIQACIFARSETDADATRVIVGTSVGDIIEWSNELQGDSTMKHKDSVLSMDLDDQGGSSGGAEWLAAGYRDGAIKVWSLATKKMLRQLPDAHRKGVTAVRFIPGTSRIQRRNFLLSSSYDFSVKIHSIRSARIGILVFLEHCAHVNDTIFIAAPMGVVSASSDGTAKFYSVDETTLPTAQGDVVASRATWAPSSATVCACLAVREVFVGAAAPSLIAIATQAWAVHLCSHDGTTVRVLDLPMRRAEPPSQAHVLAFCFQRSGDAGKTSADSAIHVLASNGAVYSIVFGADVSIAATGAPGRSIGEASSSLSTVPEFEVMETLVFDSGAQTAASSNEPVGGGIDSDRAFPNRLIVWTRRAGGAALVLDRSA